VFECNIFSIRFLPIIFMENAENSVLCLSDVHHKKNMSPITRRHCADESEANTMNEIWTIFSTIIVTTHCMPINNKYFARIQVWP
jgi:hypothetical protein